MYRVVKSTKMCSASRISKRNTKRKEIFDLVHHKTLQHKAVEKNCRILVSENESIASIGNSVFDEIDNVKC